MSGKYAILLTLRVVSTKIEGSSATMDDLSESIGTPGSTSSEGNGREAPLTHRQDAVVEGLYRTAKTVVTQEVASHASALGYGDAPDIIIEDLARASTKLTVRRVGHNVSIPQFEGEVRKSVQTLVQQLLASRRFIWGVLAMMSGNGGMAEVLHDDQGRVLSMNGVSDRQVTGVMQLLRDRLCGLPLRAADPSLPSEEEIRRLLQEAVVAAHQRTNGS